MGRFKHYDYGQMKMLPVSFEQQILPGTFEYTLNHLIDHEIDLRVFAQRRNDETGAPACDRRSCSRSSSTPIREGERSRRIERLCRENVVFMALSRFGRTFPIADFIARMDAAGV